MTKKFSPYGNRRNPLAGVGALGVTAALPGASRAGAAVPATIIRGAAIFDSRAGDLIAGSDVPIEKGMISAIGPDLAAEGAGMIDAAGLIALLGLRLRLAF